MLTPLFYIATAVRQAGILHMSTPSIQATNEAQILMQAVKQLLPRAAPWPPTPALHC